MKAAPTAPELDDDDELDPETMRRAFGWDPTIEGF